MIRASVKVNREWDSMNSDESTQAKRRNESEGK